MDEGVGSGTATPAQAARAWLWRPNADFAGCEPDNRWTGATPPMFVDGPVALFGMPTPPDLSGGDGLCLTSAAPPLEAALDMFRQAAAVGAGEAALYWPPAQLWSRFDRDFVAPSVAALERQGLPPVMHFIAFLCDEAKGSVCVRTRGLLFFAGAELRLSAPSPVSAREALRAAARLAIDAMLQRGPAGPMIVDGLNKGERLRLGAPIVEDGDRVIPVEWIPPGP